MQGLGCKAEDVISGYKGITVAHTKWLYGCSRFGIQAPVKDGNKPGIEWFDEQRVKYSGKPVIPVEIKPHQEIVLGSKVRDKVTGFAGIASSIITWATGNVEVSIEPDTLDREKKLLDGHFFHIERVEVLEVKKPPVTKEAAKKTIPGGPQRDPKERRF